MRKAKLENVIENICFPIFKSDNLHIYSGETRSSLTCKYILQQHDINISVGYILKRKLYIVLLGEVGECDVFSDISYIYMLQSSHRNRSINKGSPKNFANDPQLY